MAKKEVNQNQSAGTVNINTPYLEECIKRFITKTGYDGGAAKNYLAKLPIDDVKTLNAALTVYSGYLAKEAELAKKLLDLTALCMENRMSNPETAYGQRLSKVEIKPKESMAKGYELDPTYRSVTAAVAAHDPGYVLRMMVRDTDDLDDVSAKYNQLRGLNVLKGDHDIGRMLTPDDQYRVTTRTEGGGYETFSVGPLAGMTKPAIGKSRNADAAVLSYVTAHKGEALRTIHTSFTNEEDGNTD